MAAWSGVVDRVRAWLLPAGSGAEFERELDAHLEMLEDENLRRGMDAATAKRAARMTLGGVAQLKETNRELRGMAALDTVRRDARFALRMLRKNPAFTAAAIVTLALGIGASTTMFSVFYSVLVRPLPYPDAEQLVNIFETKPDEGVAGTGWSYQNLADLRRQNHSFSELAGSQFHSLTLTGRGEPTVVHTSVVTPALFALFRQPPLAGRTFTDADGARGAAPVTILSETLWRTAFAADPDILGTAVELDRRPFTVVGIMPAAFRFPSLTNAAQLWIPVAQDPLFGGWMERRGGHWLQVTGRLKPGVSPAQARQDLDAVAASLARDFPAENRGWQIQYVPLQDMIVGNARAPLLVLFGAVGLVLLIACANVANLLLTRATGRAREIAVRSALGAGHGRIVRQLLSESAVLGLLGGGAGVMIAYAGVRRVTMLLPPNVLSVSTIDVDRTVLAFALGLSIVSSLVFGLAPAWFTAKSSAPAVLREGGARAGEGRGRQRARKILAASEIGLAIVLLLGAGLLLRSLTKLVSVSPGFDTRQLIAADVSLPRFQYATPQQWTAFTDDLMARLHATPGLQQSAVAVPRPIVDGFVNLGFAIVGSPPVSTASARTANYVSVSPDYFRVMQIPLLAGRVFDEHDVPSAPRVAIISQTMARMYFPNQDPIGRKMAFGFPPDTDVIRDIVGVVGDVRDVAVGQEPGPMMYAAFAQAPFWGANVVVRTPLDTAAAATSLRAVVQSLDRGLPVTDIVVMRDVIDGSLAERRFRTLLLGLFAAVALVLAATGIFAVISYSVSRRTNEIGIRVALGATRRTILGMISRETAALTLAGVAIGVPSAVAASRLIGHMLFGVSGHDPLTVVTVVAALVSVAALAAYIPARRALRVNPLDALRHE